jgi:hypothetical protein
MGYNAMSADQGFEAINWQIYRRIGKILSSGITAKNPADRKPLDELTEDLLLLYAEIHRKYSRLPKYRGYPLYMMKAVDLEETVTARGGIAAYRSHSRSLSQSAIQNPVKRCKSIIAQDRNETSTSEQQNAVEVDA